MNLKRTAAVLAVAALTLAGCGSGDSESDNNGGGNGGGGDLTYAMVTHSKPGDAFWDVVKSGGEQAAKDLGVTMNYSSDPDPAIQSQLIDNAVAKKVDGIVVSMANPDGLKDAVEGAVKAGIPVITINSGLEKSKEFGAMTHVGQSEEIAGEAAGTKMAEGGAKKLLCVIHEAGNIGLEQRCAGAKKTFGGEVETLQVDIANLADVQATISSKLTQDKSIDALLTLNPGVALAAVQAKQAGTSKAAIGTFDVSEDVTTAITAGDIDFAIDQEPYVQGYLPIVLEVLKSRNGSQAGGGQPVYSGPSFVTKDNAADVAKFAANGTR